MKIKSSNNISLLKNELEVKGYVKIHNFISPDNFANIHNGIYRIVEYCAYMNNIKLKSRSRSELDSLLINLIQKDKVNSSFIYDSLNLCNEYNEFISLPIFSEFAENWFSQCSEKEPIVILNNRQLRFHPPHSEKETNLPWHRDADYNNKTTKSSFVLWVPLFDVNNKIGNIIAKEGSHDMLESPEAITFNYSPNRKVISVNVDNVDNNIYPDTVLPDCKIGDVIMLNMFVIHKSGMNVTNKSVRWTSQIRYHNATELDFTYSNV
jgi:ectoine hydroxylase-related dioxygenase (phytanoyl-CoA dioxygenase family)